jgi:hypothetical protein
MRWIIAPILLLAGSVIAQDQYHIDHECVSDGIVLQVAMARPGVLTFKIPFDLCGRGV